MGFIYIFIGCALMYTLFANVATIFEQKDEVAVLTEQRNKIVAERDALENEVELLNNDDYVTRYARENYVFTRDGEQVAIIPGVEETEE